jgi:hypothetical protein
MTPTYPKWSTSQIEGIKKTTMSMFNRRKDVRFYEIGVFNKDWKPIPFVTSYKILKLEYLNHIEFDIYAREEDVKDAEYVCSLSKLQENNDNKPILATKICSRFK